MTNILRTLCYHSPPELEGDGLLEAANILAELLPHQIRHWHLMAFDWVPDDWE